ncbi:hypothetical protein W97_08467 [Coniosporium apollinis CBS 100218]|uniref:Uncharacterized protein n=1 Tax=Coniosporium apollinis (strain CBS 100218) TaxID=1168221 RepID=R7Z531_CONA1|nr:uncharacterized protein W97_08467 [Coniosporium apollinis CBS 100218]EON69208.1 hypothetical protein W97_08467 [Coniosporium apollinis CBS 100218]
MSSTKSTLTFFGATGGCAAATLALALKAGHIVTALARTPSKLTTLLTSTHGIPQHVLDSNLIIVKGDIKDITAVKKALLSKDGRIVDIVVSGIGGTPALQWSLLRPVTLTDPHICERAAATILSALRELRQSRRDDPLQSQGEKSAQGPMVIAISTTGVSTKQRDVPFLIYPLYHWLLQVPHADKQAMEQVLIADASSTSPAIGDFAIVRPTLLTDGVAKGTDTVKMGWEYPEGKPEQSEPAPGPALGYSVSRADVGAWIFEQLVEGEGKWGNKCVTLTY